MKNWNFKILLQVAGILVLVTSILALQGVLAGIGLGIAGMLIFGPNVEQIKGKTAGIVYVNGKTGPYTRARINAKNPQTDAQQANRQKHRDLMKLWKTEQVDKVAFNLYAANYPVPNRMGRMACISGINWFVKINRYAKKADPNCGLITRPPSTETIFPIITGMNITANFEGQSVVIEPITIANSIFQIADSMLQIADSDSRFQIPDSGMKLDVWATMQMSAGVSSTKNFRSLGVYDPSLSNSIDISADYIARFGKLQSGMKLFIKVRLITTNGEADLFVGKGAVVTSPLAPLQMERGNFNELY